MRSKHRIGRKAIMLPDSTTAEPADATQETLVIAIARAYRWLALLEEGRFNSVGDHAEAVDMDPSLLRRHVNLTLIIPAMVRRVLDGTEPEWWSVNGMGREVDVFLW